ncbi:BON domain-containing protein [Sphingomonas oryzagri]
MKKSDGQLQRDVLDELAWEPSVDQAELGVSVVDGVVTLSGFVTSYAEKIAAEKAARRVAGVRAIAEEIKVRFASDRKTGDAEVAKRIADILAWDALVPDDGITIKVEHGWVTLSGMVDWNYQANAAGKAAGKITGVTGIINLIAVRQHPVATDVRDRILDAFRRQANLDAGGISVRTDGGKVVLTGQVKAWYERGVAERAAWSAPGVTRVEDHLTVA